MELRGAFSYLIVYVILLGSNISGLLTETELFRMKMPKDNQRSIAREEMTVKSKNVQGEEGVSLLIQRLSSAGVPIGSMSTCDDLDWSRLEAKHPGYGDEEKKDASESSSVPYNSKDATTEIKTLVWQVSYDSDDHATSCVNVDGGYEHRDKFYIVTALRIEDKVDTSSLRDRLQKEDDLPFGCTASLSMAPQLIAESLTGFQSGCMPPVGHSTPMKLFVDNAICHASNVRTASMGAGILGKSLLLPLAEFLRVAKECKRGATFGSFAYSTTLSLPSTSSTNSQKEDHMDPLEIRKERKLERSHRKQEPKDRLKEYRRFDDILSKAKLLRTTARKQGRVDDMERLVEEAVRQSDFPELFNASSEDGMDKNALHLCAWRGDFDSVKLLVRTAKMLHPDLDLINMISMGEGNYGKTPIFFALTQCREDVVRYLVSEGANLLIVNNKGQTPSSIAVSHLKEDACKYLFNVEAEQLRAGGSFVNYRISHSDGKLYGDLDPRFPIDDDNLRGNDVSDQIKQFNESKQNAPLGTVYNGVPTCFEPRSIRPTVRWWIREARSLEAANRAGCDDGVVTFTQPRRPSISKNSHYDNNRRSKSPQRKQFAPPPNVNDLPRLLLADALEGENTGGADVAMVQDLNSIWLLEQEVARCIDEVSQSEINEKKSFDEIVVDSTWGVDCEWKPGKDCGIDNPVATLQLSTRQKAFLVDLQCLCHSTATDSANQREAEKRLDYVLSKLFSNADLPIIGYGVMQDLGKLAGSFPNFKCFTYYSSVVDLQAVSAVVHPKPSRRSMSSLQKIVACLLRQRLDKSQQCSNWTIRPLSEAQMEYAMLDAAVLPLLLSRMINENTVVDRYNGQFFKVHTTLRSTIRYTKVQAADGHHTYDVPMGTVKAILGRQFARQSWPPHQADPGLPRLVSIQFSEKSLASKRERAHLRKVGGKSGEKRPKPVQLKTLAGNLENLPMPGITLGYTKDSCVFRVVGHELLNTFPEGTYVGFNRRAGVVETTNAWIVFCNFGTRPYQGLTMEGRSFSEFYEGGRQLSFRLNPKAKSGGSSEASLYRYLTGAGGSNEDAKKLLLFVRDGTKSKYLYCGLGECVKWIPLESGATSVMFELLEFDRLIGHSKISPDFEGLVASRQEIMKQAVGSL